jgi:hypothetical protein
MFTDEQLEQIDGHLKAGQTPEQIAALMGMSRSQFYHKLLRRGRVVVISRKLGMAGDVPVAEEATARPMALTA